MHLGRTSWFRECLLVVFRLFMHQLVLLCQSHRPWTPRGTLGHVRLLQFLLLQLVCLCLAQRSPEVLESDVLRARSSRGNHPTPRILLRDIKIRVSERLKFCRQNHVQQVIHFSSNRKYGTISMESVINVCSIDLSKASGKIKKYAATN